MQECLDRLNIPLKIIWQHDNTKTVHGEIDNTTKTLFIYDADYDLAWETLLHEVLEWKMKDVTNIYRTIINSLIETLEKLAYERKERFLDSIPNIIQLLHDEERKDE